MIDSWFTCFSSILCLVLSSSTSLWISKIILLLKRKWFYHNSLLYFPLSHIWSLVSLSPRFFSNSPSAFSLSFPSLFGTVWLSGGSSDSSSFSINGLSVRWKKKHEREPAVRHLWDVMICGSQRITGSWILWAPMKGIWWTLRNSSGTSSI